MASEVTGPALYGPAAPYSKSIPKNALTTTPRLRGLRHGPPGGYPRKTAQNHIFPHSFWPQHYSCYQCHVRLGDRIYGRKRSMYGYKVETYKARGSETEVNQSFIIVLNTTAIRLTDGCSLSTPYSLIIMCLSNSGL